MNFSARSIDFDGTARSQALARAFASASVAPGPFAAANPLAANRFSFGPTATRPAPQLGFGPVGAPRLGAPQLGVGPGGSSVDFRSALTSEAIANSQRQRSLALHQNTADSDPLVFPVRTASRPRVSRRATPYPTGPSRAISNFGGGEPGLEPYI